MDEKTWIYPLAMIGFMALMFGILSIISKFDRLCRDNRYFKEDIKELQEEITELKYKRKD